MRTAKNREALFSRFQSLQSSIKLLGSIVQYGGNYVTDKDLQVFSEQTNGVINELKSLNSDIVQHFSNEADLVGDWDNELNAFLYVASGCKWVAYKGSHQIFVYWTKEPLAPPYQIIQNPNPITTIQEFTNTIRHGSIHNLSYKEE